MAKRVMSFDEFCEKVVCGVQRESWMPEEGSPLEDQYELLSGFQEGDYLYKETEDSDPIPMEHIEQEGGGEGSGEYCYAVIQVGEKFYKIEYSYYSYRGYDYDGADVLEVVPTQRMVTFYE